MQKDHFELDGEDFETLSRPERIRHCREMARRALVLSQSAPPSYRKAYAEIAREWSKLADDIEGAEHHLSP
jgi:hypothetical protein